MEMSSAFVGGKIYPCHISITFVPLHCYCIYIYHDLSGFTIRFPVANTEKLLTSNITSYYTLWQNYFAMPELKLLFEIQRKFHAHALTHAS